MIRVYSLLWFFVGINKRLTFFTVFSDLLLPWQNFRNYLNIIFFRSYIAIQIRDAIDIKGKGISFTKQLNDKFRIIGFY